MVVSVRRMVEDDLEKTMNWRMQEDVTRYMNTDPILTLEGQKKWFDKVKKDVTLKYWMIEVDGVDAGVINLAGIDREKGESNWAYYIGEKSLRSFELAVTLEWNLYDYVFHNLGLKRLYNEVLSKNKGVINLHKFCGSKVDAIYKDRVEKNGQKYDVTAISITKEEWFLKKKEAEYSQIDFERS